MWCNTFAKKLIKNVCREWIQSKKWNDDEKLMKEFYEMEKSYIDEKQAENNKQSNKIVID